jgi:MFS family permease
MFWQQSHVRNLPEVVGLSAAEKNRYATTALFLVMVGSLVGNFVAGGLAKLFGYRHAIAGMLAAYAVAMAATYWTQPTWSVLRYGLVIIGLCQGVFGLFTMCLPPLFPVLLRTTGAGFCYNFGRIISAGGVVFFGMMSTVGDVRAALFYAGLLFWPAALIAMLLPEEKAETAA